jgi:hypothetical protein
MTRSATKVSIKALHVAFNITDTQHNNAPLLCKCHYSKAFHYSECCISFIVLLYAVMRSVVILDVVILNVVLLSVVAPSRGCILIGGKTSCPHNLAKSQ